MEEQYNEQEKLSIMNDLSDSLRNARNQRDEARIYYTQEAINAVLSY